MFFFNDPLFLDFIFKKIGLDIISTTCAKLIYQNSNNHLIMLHSTPNWHPNYNIWVVCNVESIYIKNSESCLVFSQKKKYEKLSRNEKLVGLT